MKNMESKKHLQGKEVTFKTPDNKTFSVYFPTVEDLEKFNIFLEDAIKSGKKKLLEKAITGKEFKQKALKKAVKWNHGKVPYIGVRHTFLINALDEPGVKVLMEEEKEFPGEETT